MYLTVHLYLRILHKVCSKFKYYKENYQIINDLHCNFHSVQLCFVILQKFLVSQSTNNVCKSQTFLMNFDEQLPKITIQLHENLKITTCPGFSRMCCN